MIDNNLTTFERTILVGIINSYQSEDKLNEYLAELNFLTYTAGGKVIKQFKQKIRIKKFNETKYCNLNLRN